MDDKKAINRTRKIQMGVYRSSMGISMTALTIVGLLEIFMLVYTLANPGLYEQYIWKYRIFYISLLTVAAVYICLYLFVKRDLEHRYLLLNIANPICAAFFFAWAIGITWSDAMIYEAVDAMVFMTFSLTVPMSFFLFPAVYAVIVVAADGLMLYLTWIISDSVAPLINFSIFCVFQIVLGVSFMQLKKKLAQRIVEEQENADIDVLTGFPNRRAYEEDMDRFQEESREDLAYLSIDLNGLKETNDRHGHEAGDRLIVGAARCMEQCFGSVGKMYRVGGDEFVVLLRAASESLDGLLTAYEQGLQAWSEENGLSLSTAIGCVWASEFPEDKLTQLARVADRRMYAAKASYYQRSGRDRRRSREEGSGESGAVSECR